MMDAAVKQQTISELADEAISACDGDVREAANYLERKAKQNAAVWMTLTAPLISSACYDAVRAVMRKERRAIWYSPNYDKGGNGDRVIQHSNTLMDMRLPGGKMLRDATKADLEAAAQFYHQQAKTMRAFGVFLDTIARKVKRSTVGTKLTEDELIEIRETCYE